MHGKVCYHPTSLWYELCYSPHRQPILVASRRILHREGTNIASKGLALQIHLYKTHKTPKSISPHLPFHLGANMPAAQPVQCLSVISESTEFLISPSHWFPSSSSTFSCCFGVGSDFTSPFGFSQSPSLAHPSSLSETRKVSRYSRLTLPLPLSGPLSLHVWVAQGSHAIEYCVLIFMQSNVIWICLAFWPGFCCILQSRLLALF